MTTGPISISPTARVFILTGAGISAESGISTFRDAGGLWEKYRFEEVASPEAWARDPELVWRFYSARRKQAAACEPNAAHRALAALEEQLGHRLFLCTQNVDPLHERAGSRNALHMHGELAKTRCENEDCKLPPFVDDALYETAAKHAFCKACGGRLRPHIVWFGEVPLGMRRIGDELERCDLFVTIGSSGAVYPAAAFVNRAQQRGVKTVYVGPEAPDNARSFDEIRLGKGGEVVPGLFNVESER